MPTTAARAGGRRLAVRAVVVAGLCLLLTPCLVGGYAVLARYVLHGSVDGASLARSVVAASDSSDGLLGRRPCRPAGEERLWNCTVSDVSGSGEARYRVRVRPDSSCWDATVATTGADPSMPRELDGCVHRWQWSLTDLL